MALKARKANTYRAARRNAAKGSVWPGAKARVEPYQGRGKVYRKPAPGHTDLMVTPESIDAFMEANPLPISRVLGGRRA